MQTRSLLVSLAIAMGSVALSGQVGTPHPSYSTDIAPLIASHCASCHRPGGAAPFSLLKYEDVRPRARQILDVTKRRLMPPWLPEPGFGHFKGERRLSEAEISVIEQWVGGGARRGERDDSFEKPAAVDSVGGQPDVILTLPAFNVPANGPEIFRNFSVAVPIAARQYVRAVEFFPGRSQSIHHARILLDESGVSRRLDERDAAPGYDGMLQDEAHFPEGHFIGWTPGKRASIVPQGMEWALEPHMRLVAQLHIRPTGTAESIHPSVRVYFSRTAPSITPTMIRLGSKAIDIAPGDGAYTITDAYILPVDVSLYAVLPHAHYLARQMRVYADFPDKHREWLLYIKSWNFDWQEDYQYERPLLLPKNTTIVVQYTYDNSDANRKNPSRPARRVTYGLNSTDEMADLLLQVVARSPADTERLRADFRSRELAQSIDGAEIRLKVNPTDPDLLQDLAGVYVQAGRRDEALDLMNRALLIAPQSPDLQYNLGTILATNGKTAEARSHFERAVATAPHFAEAQYALGTLLLREQSVEQAIVQLRRALELNPFLPEAHNQLASALAAVGNTDEALSEYREAVRLAPGFAEAHNNLGVMLRSMGNVSEAIREFRLAVVGNHDYAEAQFNLGESLVRVGNRDEAVLYLRGAVERRPEWPQALITLADALLDGGDSENILEALRLSRRAAELTRGTNPWVLCTLAAAVAAAGDPAAALPITRRAIMHAEGLQDEPLMRRLRLQLESFPAREKVLPRQ